MTDRLLVSSQIHYEPTETTHVVSRHIVSPLTPARPIPSFLTLVGRRYVSGEVLAETVISGRTYVCVCVRVRVSVCVCVCVRACVRACVRVFGGEGKSYT